MFKTTAFALTALFAVNLPIHAFAEQGPMAGPGMMPFERFDEIDADKDGKVTKDEIGVFMAARALEADADKDGKLSAAELVAMHEQAQAGRKLARATKMIDKMDGDKDGFLTPAEMAAAPGPGKMFEHADADDDGAISREEVAEMQTRLAENGHKGGHERGHGHGGGFFRWMNDNE